MPESSSKRLRQQLPKFLNLGAVKEKALEGALQVANRSVEYLNRFQKKEESGDAYQQYLRSLDQLCQEIRPERILEFGSGASTRIFARYAQVTCIEYDPPGDWLRREQGAAGLETVEFHFVPQEEGSAPRNLVETFFSVIHREVGEQIERDCRLINQQSLPWDLAFVDGAVHVKGFTANPEMPGWAPGDLSYLGRSMIAGLCSLVSRHVVVDDLEFLPNFRQASIERRGRFFLLKREE